MMAGRLAPTLTAAFAKRRLKLTREERLAIEHEHGFALYEAMAPELQKLLLQRSMDANCPDCGEHQAATHYCFRCFLPLLTSDWYNRRELMAEQTRAHMTDAQREAFAASRERLAKLNASRAPLPVPDAVGISHIRLEIVANTANPV